MPVVHQLICGLAEYEREPDAVEVTVDQLSSDYSEKRFEVILAENTSGVVGMALYYPRYSTWKGTFLHLEDLFVLPEYRGAGIGRLLLEAVVYHSREIGALRMGWEVLDWNTPAVKFYESLGADIEKQWWQCRLYKEGMDTFPFRNMNQIKNLFEE